MKKTTWNRREFTRNLGLATVAAPFLSMLGSGPVNAQAPGKAKYLLVFYTTGTHPDLWEPTGSTPTSINFSEMMEPLAAIKEDLVVVNGLSSMGTAESHGQPGGLTGFTHGAMGWSFEWNRGRDSIERWIADQLKLKGVNTPISDLVLGGVATQAPSSFFRSGKAIPAIESVSQAYSNIFSGAPAPVAQPAPGEPTGNTTAAMEAARLLARRQSTLDQVTAELNMLKNHLGAQEAQLLDHHLSSVRAVENRLALQAPTVAPGNNPNPVVTQPVECNAPRQPGGGSLHQSWVDQAELAVAAFGCDLTRVAVVQFGHHQEAIIDIPGVASGDWHNTFLHNNLTHEPLVKIEQWVAQEFVNVCTRLKEAPAPTGGSLWDQTLVCWMRDMGDAVGHSSEGNMRQIFTGGAGGYLAKSPNGRYLRMTGQDQVKGLYNMCDAMGITDLAPYAHPLTSPLDGIAS